MSDALQTCLLLLVGIAQRIRETRYCGSVDSTAA